MRHLAGHRTAQQTGDLVVSVSERRRIVSLYRGPYGPHVLEDIGVVLSKANSALATLEKFVGGLRDEARTNAARVRRGRDPARGREGHRTFEYSVRIAEEIEAYVRELGQEGRLVEMQLGAGPSNVPDQYDALIRDYAEEDVDYEEIRKTLQDLSNESSPTRGDGPALGLRLSWPDGGVLPQTARLQASWCGCRGCREG